MDWELVKRWNQVVAENDVVYHLGDFGDSKYLSHLNGEKIFLIIGNYESMNNGAIFQNSKVEVIQDHSVVVIRDKSFRLIHAPENIKYNDEFYLFGHIHKLQLVKKFGLNVGVDCHDFRPINEETVYFIEMLLRSITIRMFSCEG